VVEREAEMLSEFPDSAYLSAGAQIVSKKAAWKADIGVCHPIDLYNINPT
jgi:NAD/NADP transhydrogenase alpha subunit